MKIITNFRLFFQTTYEKVMKNVNLSLRGSRRYFVAFPTQFALTSKSTSRVGDFYAPGHCLARGLGRAERAKINASVNLRQTDRTGWAVKLHLSIA